MVRNAGRVTRFVVMAVLQAARAETLGLPHASALSWGLNRAIFYAAAKSGFREAPKPEGDDGRERAEGQAPAMYPLGDDGALRDPGSKELLFTIGGETQTVERFDKQVAARFGTPENFRAAWQEALQLLAKFDRPALESRTRFYGEVYKPIRDELSDAWTQRYSPPPKRR